MQKVLLLLPLFYFSSSLMAQCPKEGDATTPEKKKLNVFKNKGVSTPAGQPQFLPLKNLLPSVKRNDRGLYGDGAYVYTEGILVSFEEEGPESCNCQAAKKSRKDGDVHMYLGLKKDALKKNCIVVEITPAYKKKHPNYAQSLQKNSKVRISGYLLYDFIHESDAMTTCTKCDGAWRKTCWEIHPVINIKLLPE